MSHTSRVLCFGVNNQRGLWHLQQELAYGTQIVAGIEYGCGGQKILDIPLFDAARDAKKHTDANVALVMNSPSLAADAILEAEDAGISLVVCITTSIPLHDLVTVKRILARRGRTRLIGPNSCGVITPGQCKVGIMPGFVWSQGNVGMIASCDTLAYEAAWMLTNAGIGQSTFIGIGAEAISGMSFVEGLELFERDFQTTNCLLIGQPSGEGEFEVVEWLKTGKRKRLVAYIPGRTTVSAKKISALHKAGAICVDTLSSLANTVARVINIKG